MAQQFRSGLEPRRVERQVPVSCVVIATVVSSVPHLWTMNSWVERFKHIKESDDYMHGCTAAVTRVLRTGQPDATVASVEVIRQCHNAGLVQRSSFSDWESRSVMAPYFMPPTPQDRNAKNPGRVRWGLGGVSQTKGSAYLVVNFRRCRPWSDTLETSECNVDTVPHCAADYFLFAKERSAGTLLQSDLLL
nr:hypothetical protein CFP56_36325 [Quercus suber]